MKLNLAGVYFGKGVWNYIYISVVIENAQGIWEFFNKTFDLVKRREWSYNFENYGIIIIILTENCAIILAMS
jgi:hypothetical protein